MMQLRVADLTRDQDLLPVVRRIADRLLTHHSESVRRLLQRWIGAAARYGQV